MQTCDHGSFTHGVGPNDLPCRQGVPLTAQERAIANGLRSLRAILGSDAEKHAVVLSAHYVLDALGHETTADRLRSNQVQEIRKAFLDTVEGK